MANANAKVFLKQLSEQYPNNPPQQEFIGLILLSANDFAELSAKQEHFLAQMLDPANLHGRRDVWHAMQIATFVNTCRIRS